MNQVCHAIHCGACRGVVGTLAFVQFRSGYELGIGGLSEDMAGGALEDMEDDFGMVAEAMVDLLLMEDIINGSP